jgi:hypothetical protein
MNMMETKGTLNVLLKVVGARTSDSVSNFENHASIIELC